MSTESLWMEHRWGSRVELHALARLRTVDGRETDVWVRNASLSGAFVETTSRLGMLTLLSLRPLTAGGEWLDACVVRVEEGGIALEWLEPGTHSIFTLLSMRREAPAASAREHAALAAAS